MPHKNKLKNRKYQRIWAQKRRAKRTAEGTKRNYFLWTRYGISEQEWNALFERQGRKCAICRSEKPKSKVGWHTDHDHTTKKVRGILCENCNRGLGMYRDDITLLQRAAAYLGIHYGVLGAEATREAGVFQPFSEKGIHNGMSFGSGSASYDIRLDQNTELKPHEFKLASSREYFSMPDDVVGVVHDKSSHARRGVSVFNTVIDPGWRGYLTLELVNHSEVTVRLSAGDPIAQVILHSLDEPAEKPYEGKYQDQPRGPQIPLKEDGSAL